MTHSQVGASRGIDTTTILTVYVCLLLAIPSPMVVSPLGSAGAPSAIMAIGNFLLWGWFHIQRSTQSVSGHQPARAAAVGWLLAMLLVYVHAVSSPIPGDEISVADSGMLKVVGLVGVVLLANDGISSLERSRALLRRLVIGAGLLAVLGLIQYATKQLFVDRIDIPGLTAGTANWTLAERSGLSRPSGTSTHPIEYGVVLTMVLPIAITFAIASPTRRWLYRAFLCAIAFAIFLSISRSAMLCAAVGLLVLAISWSAAARLRALVAALGVAVLVYLTVPGVLGTITRLFTGVNDDASVNSRTGSYELAGDFISKSPLLGRGFGTFLPKYWILDNGYLGLLIEAGIVGLGGLLTLFATAAAAARRARRMAVDEFDRGLAQALLASIAAGACSLAFFDTFAFPQSAGCLFLILGMAGAMRRLTLAEAGTDKVGHVEAPVTASVALTPNAERLREPGATEAGRESAAESKPSSRDSGWTVHQLN